MRKTSQTPLVVYKASAGSGKTFTLTIEYIKLLIDNPLSYQNTLAVTFTNKATEEMKLRILSQLNGLSHGYPDSSDYMAKITHDLRVDESLVRERASTALHSLIHNYSSFRVETIDKFFQRVLKNLARELDLTANLRIELNDKQVEQMAVDTLIDSLDHNHQVLGWIMNYIIESIGEDKKWNVIGQVKQFGANIFKDIYKSNRASLQAVMSDEHFFDNFRLQLWQLKEKNKQLMQSHGQRFFDMIGSYTTSDFSYGMQGVYGYFAKLKSGQYDNKVFTKHVAPCLEEAEKWVQKKAPHRATIIQMVKTTLMSLLKEAEQDRKQCYMMSKSADLTLIHLNELRLLGKIEDMVRRLNNDNNRFLLSDTQAMLNALIGNSDTPFIFERIGAHLQHIMIDEFQDTGAVQWSNFKILLNDCMHQGNSNLIVGDVKQSIYRWRSGDWRLLNDITSQFGNHEKMVTVAPLDTNYRSCRKIVEFNNSFFVVASRQEYLNLNETMGNQALQLQTAYSDVVQKVPSSKPDDGYVHVELMPKEVYQSHLMEHIAETIGHLLNHGVAQRDIAILARTNSEIQATAQYFQSNNSDINIVSDEAFRLDASLAVNILITAMNVLADEKNVLAKCHLAKTYQNQILEHPIADNQLMLSYDTKEPEKAFSDWLPQGFRESQDMALLRSMPLTDLVETLYNLFDLNRAKGQSAYICAFHDALADYLMDNTSDIMRFLHAWEEKYAKKTIHGDDMDGIRIVTIHKSKGLEFDNVIIPFCNWTLEKQGRDNIIWCESSTPPFNQLPILPIVYSKKQMEGTVYENDYQMEHLQNTVDNLNLLYVAFTRARTRMFVYGVKEKEKEDKKSNKFLVGRSALIEQCLPMLLHPIKTNHSEGEYMLPPLDGTLETNDMGSIVFDYGECFDSSYQPKQERKNSENIFQQPDACEPFQIKTYPTKVQFRQSNESKAFVGTDDERQPSQYLQRGNLLHGIFSQMKTLDDMERVLQDYAFHGLTDDEISSEELCQLLSKALSNPTVRDWFSPKWTVHNECNILCPKEGTWVTLRPDRVMDDGHNTIVVDFKFGKPLATHRDQVAQYTSLLKQMGHSHVEGYIWYVFDNQVVKI